tara:strand:+ start:6301 stop:6474 length:174 start_codon:yes stop_codon:yes gene_type:complete
VRPDHKEFIDGVKLAAIAIAAAALTATLVIGAGRAVLDRSPPESVPPTSRLNPAAGR